MGFFKFVLFGVVLVIILGGYGVYNYFYSMGIKDLLIGKFF
jgi:hypothetical protein